MMQIDFHPTQNLVDVLKHRALTEGDRVACTFLAEGDGQETHITYGELDRRARATASILQGLAAPGDRALLLFPAGLDYIIAFFGCFYAGLVAVPAYPPDPTRLERTLPRLKSILKDSQPTLALTTSAILAMAEQLFLGDKDFGALQWVATDSSDGAERSYVEPVLTESSLAFLQYTSGSTRDPRGVMLTHSNLLANLEVMRRCFGMSDKDRVASWLPPYHDMGLIGSILLPLYAGAPLILMSPMHFMRRPFAWLSAISRHRVTVTGGPNFAYELCSRKVSEEQRATLDLSCLEVACVAAEPVRARTLDVFAKMFGSCGFDRKAFLPCYGLAEATLMVTGASRQAGFRVHSFSKPAYEQKRAVAVSADAVERIELVSSGAARAGLEVVVVNPDSGTLCGEHEIGEIWISGPSVARGYWGRSEETRATFHAELVSAPAHLDGRKFMRSGDLGFLRDGELIVSGRIKDLIIIRGRNHHPQDIEATVDGSHPRIRRGCCAAFSLESQPRTNTNGAESERLVVVAELATGVDGDGDHQEIVLAIQRAIAEVHEIRVDNIVLIMPGTIHKTSSGKIQRGACREEFLAGTLSEVARSALTGVDAQEPAPRNEEVGTATAGKTAAELEQWLIKYVSHGFGLPTMNIERTSRLTDLGLDSVEAALLAGELETFLNRPISATLAWEFPTIELMARHLAGAPVSMGRPHPHTRELAPSEARQHPYTEYVNPHLGKLLERFKLDKSFVRGSGCDLYDAEGRHYLDFVASYGALPFGHNPKEVWAALLAARESEKPGFVQPSLLPSAGELARRLIGVAPSGLRYVTFTNSGAEAVEAAIKLCRTRTGRLGILSTVGSFHGKTLGALSATGNTKYHHNFGAPVPFFHRIPFGDIEALRDALLERPAYHAAFVVEPIQGEGGIVEPPAGYLAAAKKLCREAGVLLVFDEVQTGLGRTGTLFASSAEGVEPDVMALAKALGGGLLPIGACISSEDAYSEDFALKHSSTFAGGTLACEAGLATLELLERDNFALVKRVAENGARLKGALLELQRRYPRLISQIRGRGYFLGIQLGVNRRTWPSSILALAAEEGGLAPIFASYLLNVEGVRIAPTLNNTDVLRIEPPLTATWQQCEVLIGALERTLAVFDTGDAGRVLGSILSRAPRSAPEVMVRTMPRAPIQPRPDEGRFAFILHPLELRSYARFDSTLASVGAADLENAARIAHGMGKPAIVSETRIVSKSGRSAYGEFILVARTADELMAMPREAAAKEVRDAVELARGRGARIVGLGAFTSIVTHGGLTVADSDIAVTTGNTFTAVSALEGVRLALRTWRPELTAPVVAVVGAAGAIGRATAILMAEDASLLILIGNPLHSKEHNRSQLLRVAGEACRYLAVEASRNVVFRRGTLAHRMLTSGLLRSPDLSQAEFTAMAEQLEREGLFLVADGVGELLPLADVVILATNATTALVQPHHLRQNALVCDLSRPRNVSQEVQEARPDVLVIDGGVIEIPGRPDIGSFDLAPGLTYACMAETMMLALEQRYAHMSLGANIDVAGLRLMRQLADMHGFKVAALRSFDSPLPAEGPTRTAWPAEAVNSHP
jgi:acetylornithine/succinyldiaminopimelate/putrescine aminotransferase/acyl-CoA synthetase (AMP-forming)/AMP-acid ligase II/predicted amino acid dehydrogenase/acyl carrier protein